MAVEQNIETLLRGRTEIADLFRAFNERSIRWAIYAGCETALLAANRVPTDIDIIVHDDDFEATASLLPQMKRYDNQPETVTTSEGQKVGFVCSGIVGQLGGTDIDIMANATFEVDGAVFPVRLTDYAAAHRLEYHYQDNAVFLANPFDTILIKAFMRRGAEQHKFDLSDAEALRKAADIDGDYKAQRLEQVGSTPEVLTFLEKVGA
jgi:hypothetical protein